LSEIHRIERCEAVSSREWQQSDRSWYVKLEEVTVIVVQLDVEISG